MPPKGLYCVLTLLGPCSLEQSARRRWLSSFRANTMDLIRYINFVPTIRFRNKYWFFSLQRAIATMPSSFSFPRIPAVLSLSSFSKETVLIWPSLDWVSRNYSISANASCSLYFFLIFAFTLFSCVAISSSALTPFFTEMKFSKPSSEIFSKRLR